MNFSFKNMSSEERSQYMFGVGDNGIAYIPYTGWGNTVENIVYDSEGNFVNSENFQDRQWGAPGDLYPDGPVFQTLEQAFEYAKTLPKFKPQVDAAQVRMIDHPRPSYYGRKTFVI